MKTLALFGSLISSLFAVSAMAAPIEIDFNARPSYIPNNVVVLTFDDGPDWNNTAKVLDILKQKQAKASFFINAENWSSLSQDVPMRDLVKRMVAEGHELANHSFHHNHLGELPAADVAAEISGVQTAVNSIFGASAPKLTLFRAPHGEPFQGNDPANPSDAYKRVAPIVAKSAVHIGWSIDSFDYNCPQGDGNCVYNNVVNALQVPGAGSYGIILMHSVHSQTAAALPGLIDYIRSRGFKIWTTEDVVRARYGKSSAQLIGTTTTPVVNPPVVTPPVVTPPVVTPPATGTCSAAAWVQGRYYRVGEQVVYQGQLFTAQNQDNPGYDPKISTWFWKAGAMCNGTTPVTPKPPVTPTPVTPTPTPTPVAGACNGPLFKENTPYKIGQVVVYEKQYFTAQNENNPGYNPKISTWFWKAGALCK